MFFAAAYVQALSGFGFAMLAMPLLLLHADPVDALFATTLAGALLSGWGAAADRGHVDRDRVARLTGWALLGVPAGLYLVTVLDSRALQVIVVAAVLVAVLAELRPRRTPLSPAGVSACGVTSGVMLACSGINGPPLVMALRSLDPLRYRATLQATFCLQETAVVAGLLLIGRATAEGFLLAAAGLLVMPLGWRLGSHAFGALDPARLRWVILAGLVLTAAAVLLTG